MNSFRGGWTTESKPEDICYSEDRGTLADPQTNNSTGNINLHWCCLYGAFTYSNLKCTFSPQLNIGSKVRACIRIGAHYNHKFIIFVYFKPFELGMVLDFMVRYIWWGIRFNVEGLKLNYIRSK